MRIIEIEPRMNGAHRDQYGDFFTIPIGWAVIPYEMEIPDTFPFVDIEVKGDIVVSMTAADATKPKPTQLDMIEAQVAYTAMMTDTLLEV